MEIVQGRKISTVRQTIGSVIRSDTAEGRRFRGGLEECVREVNKFLRRASVFLEYVLRRAEEERKIVERAADVDSTSSHTTPSPNLLHVILRSHSERG